MAKKQKRKRARTVRTLYALEFPISGILEMSREEQNLLILFASALNELAALVRIVTMSAQKQSNGELHELFVLSQHITLTNIYAGKVYETWQMIRHRYYGSQLSKKYNPLLPDYINDDLKRLKKYFDKGDNVLFLLRNELGFHYTRSDIMRLLETGKSGVMITAKKFYYNELNSFADEIMIEHLCRQITDNPADAVAIVQEDVGSTGSMIHSFMRNVLAVMMTEIIKKNSAKCRTQILKVKLERSRYSPALPVFIYPDEYRRDLLRMRKRLRETLKKGRDHRKPVKSGYARTGHLTAHLKPR